MNITLKPFQENRVDELFTEARLARSELDGGGKNQAIVLASPTGSGKTVMATRLMELLTEGDEDHPGDEEAVFLWLSDDPELNQQSRSKIESDSSVFGSSDLKVIDKEGFDERRFEPGTVYFLNIQKLSKTSGLVKAGDTRNHTIWESIENTVRESPGHFWVILDEAHKGTRSEKDEQVAATIVQKFIKGSSEIPPVPLVVGISATPERFDKLLGGQGTSRTRRGIEVTPDEGRGSGLLKETLAVYHPKVKQPSDISFLRSSAAKLDLYRERWLAYCSGEVDVDQVEPILIVQVEDARPGAKKGEYSRTDLGEVLEQLEDVLGPLEDYEVAHCFQEHSTITVAERQLRYVAPSAIQNDQALRVALFKQSLNTGWDCPRAEVVMSFRSVSDYTNIAQLIGRLVRTPLARQIYGNDFLNSVALYLPQYDSAALEKVRKYLTDKDTGLAAPPDFEEGDDIVEYRRASDRAELFDKAATLPTYAIEHLSKKTHVQRLVKLGRQLTHDKIDSKALEDARTFVLDQLEAERKRKARTKKFKDQVTSTEQIEVRELRITTPIAGDDIDDPVLEESFNELAAARQNIDDVYRTCGRKIGEGLHKLWHKRRAGAGASSTQAKAELSVLLADDQFFASVQEVCEKEFYKNKQKHKTAIDALSDARRAEYRALNVTGAKGTPLELELPPSMNAGKEKASYDRHLYVDESDKFRCRLNDWETSTVETELNRSDVVGWLRNVPRKSWSFLVPYEWEGNDVPMYPDFLFFRKEESQVIVDILDPHWGTSQDSAAKARGLARFAEKHGYQFGRVEVIVKEGKSLRRLDVNRDEVRKEAVTLENNKDLRKLFGRYGAG